MLEEYAYLAAHDLRAPTQNIINFSKVLNRKLADRIDEKENSYFQLIKDSAQRLKRTTNDLLEFARINHESLNIENCKPELILQTVLEDLKSHITEKKAKVTIGDMPKTIEGDADLLRLVFQNLISNGIKFVPPERDPSVNIAYEEISEDHVFSIKDNGIGIESKNREQIFGLFKRLNSHEDFKGTEHRPKYM